jgi:UDP-N-acetylglucosamine diphosphorylase / glucose-1-phosphate thymidylyltransferase / UDP-N-acetylgalactosamine diphosphorylase / glucosamine-1-phosphate N-acetyltransferase / galactosamine-1-phosphate N-acetyltransferase
VSHALYLLDPDPSALWAPFAGARPISELRVGAHLIRERWEAFAGTETTAIFALPHLAGFVEPGVPTVAARRPVAGPALIGSSTFVPRGIAPPLPETAFRLSCQGVTVGWGVGPGATWSGPQALVATVEVSGVVLHGTYDVVRVLAPLLAEDLTARVGESDPIPAGSVVLGDPAWVVVHDTAVEPGVVFDVRQGPVVLESGVEVRAGARLEGPLWAGANTHVLGGPIRGSALGPHCRVRGELASSVFLGYANKAHDGFVGHSVIGRWANLGAGTITSNLKNTYGPVRLEVAGTPIETGLTNLGSLIGDHAKTAIGTLLATGSVIGFGANVFGAVRAPKYVPPLAWGVAGEVGGAGAGEAGARVTKQGFLTTAERVLPRRDVAVDDATRAMLERIFDWVGR